MTESLFLSDRYLLGEKRKSVCQEGFGVVSLLLICLINLSVMEEMAAPGHITFRHNGFILGPFLFCLLPARFKLKTQTPVKTHFKMSWNNHFSSENRSTLAGILEKAFGGFFHLQLQIIKGILCSMLNTGQSENKSNSEVTCVLGLIGVCSRVLLK